ncbi:acylphosphatase [Microvirga thermotolerans]|uniref:Acylphosphatase n=1 Tax=Microvirga thermotolerans TaxID=2651334 RepID=A0A5P9JYR3_9HYPH|nr:acylphosphatase [Microvirga thermotolerans]QFU16776.1 acylphosphatase [Microvirga thermotolerans]
MSPERTLHVIIHGRVQGVGFRAWIHHQAQLHGLGGWVRNRKDGTVEAVFRGPDERVEAMLRACRQGPRGAAVERIEPVEGSTETSEGQASFEVRATV